MANPITNPRFKAWNLDGTPAAGGFLFTYAAGTNTPQATYVDPFLTVLAANPVQLDNKGEAFIYGGALQYKFVVQDSTGAQLFTADYISLGGSGGGGGGGGGNTTSEWILSALTPLFISGTSFFLPNDQTATFPVGQRIRTTNTANIVYSTIISSVFATGNTTITVQNDFGNLDSGLSTVSYGILNATIPSSPAVSAVVVQYGGVVGFFPDTAQILGTPAGSPGGVGTATVIEDAFGEFTAATASYSPRVPGKYLVNAQWSLISTLAFSGICTLQVLKNGTAIPYMTVPLATPAGGLTTNGIGATTIGLVPLVQTDKIQVQFLTNSGSGSVTSATGNLSVSHISA